MENNEEVEEGDIYTDLENNIENAKNQINQVKNNKYNEAQEQEQEDQDVYMNENEKENMFEEQNNNEDDEDDRLTYTLITLDLGELIHIFEENNISFVDMLLLTKAIFAIMIGFLSSVILGLFMLPILKKLHIGQKISVFVGSAHRKKEGTPTMGGLIFIIPTIVATLGLIITGRISYTSNLGIVLLVFLGNLSKIIYASFNCYWIFLYIYA